MALNADALQQYVDENRFDLLYESAYGAPSLVLFDTQTGIKCGTIAKLTQLEGGVTFGDCTCGIEDNDTLTFTQREIAPGCIKVSDTICQYDMCGTWLSTLVRYSAGHESLGSLEEAFVQYILDRTAENLDKALYLGDTDGIDPNLNKFDGLIKILSSDLPAAQKLPAVPGESVYTTAMKTYLAIPPRAFNLQGEVGILMGSDNYRKMIAELTMRQLPYQTAPNGKKDPLRERGIDYIYLPGTSVKVYGIKGLYGTNKVIATNMNNIVFGTDYENDYETIDFWYSQDHQDWRYNIVFVAGIQVRYPDVVVMADIAPDAAIIPSVDVNILNTPLDVHSTIKGPLGTDGGVLTETL